MIKKTCPECGRTFTGTALNRVVPALNMHRMRAHRGGGPGGKKEAPAPRRRRKVVSNGDVGLHFCPRCGLNVQLAQVALAVGLKHSSS